MAIDYPALVKELNAKIRTYSSAAPDVMTSMGALGKAAYAPGALPTKIKELMALAIGIADRCDGCIAYHTKGAHRYGASREEVAETIAVAIQMGGGPSMVFGAQALAAFEQFADQPKKS